MCRKGKQSEANRRTKAQGVDELIHSRNGIEIQLIQRSEIGTEYTYFSYFVPAYACCSHMGTVIECNK